MTTTTKIWQSFSHEVLRTVEEVRDYFLGCDTTLPLVFDTETAGLEFKAPLLGISFYQPGRKAVFLATFLNPDAKEMYQVIRDNWESFPDIIAHNGLYDMIVFRSHKVCDIKVTEDSMLLVHLYDSNLQKNLEVRIREDFHYDKQKFETLIGKKWNRIDWFNDYNEILPVLAEYACEDVFGTYQLWELYSEKIQSVPTARNLYYKIEIPLLEVLCRAKLRGVYIDIPFLNSLEKVIKEEISQSVSRIHGFAGAVFNLNSPKQKAEIFYETLKLPIYGYTKTGAPSTDVNVMEKLANEGYGIAKEMVAFSSLNKLYSSYITSIPALVDDDACLRGNLNSSGTKTGRFSSNDPNLQNMPNDDRYPVRASFIAKPGRAFICLDFSQIEPRLMAHMSKDPDLIKIYHEGGDIYQGIADTLRITRKAAKVVVLAISYGLGPEKLANSIGVTQQEASFIIEDFYHRYPKFSAWKEYVERKAVEDLYVKTMFGRIRRFPELGRRGNGAAYFGGLRKSFNTVVQGSAADMLKFIMVELTKHYLKELSYTDSVIVLQVHDELLIDTDVRFAEKVYTETKRIMETTFDLRVPIIAEGKVCFNWAQMKDDSIKEFDLLNKPRASYPIESNQILYQYLCQQ